MPRLQFALAVIAAGAAVFFSAAFGLLWFGHAGLAVSEQALRVGISAWALVSLVACAALALWALRSRRVLPALLFCAVPFVFAQPGVYLLLHYGQ